MQCQSAWSGLIDFVKHHGHRADLRMVLERYQRLRDSHHLPLGPALEVGKHSSIFPGVGGHSPILLEVGNHSSIFPGMGVTLQFPLRWEITLLGWGVTLVKRHSIFSDMGDRRGHTVILNG